MGEMVGIGVDTIEISRVLKAADKGHFLQKYYSEAEQQLILERRGRAATNFAGKEAVVKAMGTGFYGIEPKEIEILRTEQGAPYVRLQGAAKQVAEEKQIRNIHLSLSDSKELATAFCICEK